MIVLFQLSRLAIAVSIAAALSPVALGAAGKSDFDAREAGAQLDTVNRRPGGATTSLGEDAETVASILGQANVCVTEIEKQRRPYNDVLQALAGTRNEPGASGPAGELGLEAGDARRGGDIEPGGESPSLLAIRETATRLEGRLAACMLVARRTAIAPIRDRPREVLCALALAGLAWVVCRSVIVAWVRSPSWANHSEANPRLSRPIQMAAALVISAGLLVATDIGLHLPASPYYVGRLLFVLALVGAVVRVQVALRIGNRDVCGVQPLVHGEIQVAFNPESVVDVCTCGLFRPASWKNRTADTEIKYVSTATTDRSKSACPLEKEWARTLASHLAAESASWSRSYVRIAG